jgi:prolyl oligopeptidase
MGLGRRVALAAFAMLAACAPRPSTVPRSMDRMPQSPGAVTTGAAPTPVPLAAPARTPVVEDIHGVKVSDPFRWLEDGESADVKAWDDLQNARTRKVLDAIPARDALRARAKELLEIGFVSAPAVTRPVGPNDHGPTRYFHTKRVGDQAQPILYVRDGVTGEDRVLVDPTKIDGDLTLALDWWYPSLDGAVVAYGMSRGGSEDSTLHVRDVATGQDLFDIIPFTRHCSLAWVPDRKGFYYTRYPEPGTVPPGDEQYSRRIYFHRLGNDWRRDRLVFDPHGAKEDYPSIDLSPNGRWLVATVFKGYERDDVYVRDRSKGDAAPWIPVVKDARSLYYADARDERLYVTTNDGAPSFRLMTVEYDHVDRALWREVIPASTDTLNGVTILGDEIVARYLHDASTRLERFTLQGKSKGPIALPTLGTASVTGPYWGGEAFVHFVSFVQPSTVMHLDLKSGTTKAWDRVGEGFAAPDVDVTMKWATSKDGTRVPMFVVAKKGLPQDGSNPTVMWGYGGFNQNEAPGFSARALLLIERGGVWVSAILRGGGEFGAAWHEAGMLGKKQNAFDDFYACASQLVAENVTSPERLGIMGGSNGGLLVAAMITQHPEAFRAAEALVPLTDMIRYPRFRMARAWIPEYGDPEDPSAFQWLYAYSPYHHVTPGTRYPATLITTAESDSRVDPMHARKLAAALEAAQSDPSRPILLRVESKAGHGAGKPLAKVVDEVVDEMSFLFVQLGVR